MFDFLNDPSGLAVRYGSLALVVIAGWLSLRLVKKLGVRAGELFLIVLFTAAAAFVWGGWYFQRAGVNVDKQIRKAEKQVQVPGF